MSIEGWKTVKVEDCCEILDYRRVPINAEEREKRIGSIPYYGANGLQGYIDDYIFDEDLILIAEDGGYFDEFATRPIAYRISGKSWVNNHAHVLRAKSDYVQDVIFYALEHKDIQPFIVGGTRAKLNQSELRSIMLSLPESLTEQTQIAAILSTVDRAIEQTEAIIAKQQRIKTGLMQDLLSRGIDVQGNIRSEATHAFKDSPLGRIPVEWEVITVSDIAEAIDPQPDHRTPPAVPEGAPYIGVSDFNEDGFINFDGARKVPIAALRKQQKAFSISEGDFVFGKIGTIGLPRRVPVSREYALSANVILLKPKETPEFVYWWMASPIVERLVDMQIHTTSQPAFGIQKIRALNIPKPSKAERQRISNLLEKTETARRETEEDLQKLKTTKIGLMQDLLTGRVRVSELVGETSEGEKSHAADY